MKEREEAKEFYGRRKKAIPANLTNYPLSAWENLKKQGVLPGITRDGETVIPDHIARTAASGEPIPHICMKIPTGGGKTLFGRRRAGAYQAGHGVCVVDHADQGDLRADRNGDGVLRIAA